MKMYSKLMFEMDIFIKRYKEQIPMTLKLRQKKMFKTFIFSVFAFIHC